jgi:hypothetical protein
MSQLRIERVLTLPSTLTASTMYIVKSATAALAEMYFTDATGAEARHVINKSEIQGLINDSVAAYNAVTVLADIAARDALTPTVNTMVMVLDATGDTTVTAGAATYIFDVVGLTWHKISEFESLDVALNWASILDKPVSAVADIDDAVTKRHTHANAAQLDLIGQDVDGKLTYNGAGVDANLAVSAW